MSALAAALRCPRTRAAEPPSPAASSAVCRRALVSLNPNAKLMDLRHNPDARFGTDADVD